MNVNLKSPCANCPFLREGAIELAPGRLADIVDGLTGNDFSNFQCHKTVHGKHGGKWVDEDENGNERYRPSGNESMCIGSAIYALKIGRPSVALRFALMTKMLTVEKLTAQNDKVIDAMEDQSSLSTSVMSIGPRHKVPSSSS